MTRPTPLPPHLRSAPFTYVDGLEAGLTPRRLRALDLAKPFRGTRSPEPIANLLQLARAYAPNMSDGQYFSHVTAAALLGMRMPESWRPEGMHVTSTAPQRAPRAHLIIGHKSGETRTVQLSGMRLASPIAAWIASAAILSTDDVIAMGDGLVRRKHPLATIDDMREAVAAHGGRRGCVRLESALSEMRPRTDSARETKLRLILTRGGYPEPEINDEIFNARGVRIAHGDLVYREYRTIVEYDGSQHADDTVQFGIDIRRLDDLMEEGWRVIRVDKSLMARRSVLFRKVTTALTSAGWQPSRMPR
jgi:hypothetical protein